MLPFSDLSYIVVIVKRIQNAFFVLLAMTELIVRVRVSSNKIQTAARSKKHSWNWTIRSLKLWDLNKRQIRSSHPMCSVRKGCSQKCHQFCNEKKLQHSFLSVKLAKLLRKFFWKTSANDSFWQMISGVRPVAWPTLFYTTKIFFKYLFP